MYIVLKNSMYQVISVKNYSEIHASIILDLEMCLIFGKTEAQQKLLHIFVKSIRWNMG